MRQPLRHGRRGWAALLLIVGVAATSDQALAQGTGGIPISDLGTGLYLNTFQGGLYPDGLNAPPADHLAGGIAASLRIQPLNTAGQPSAAGKYVLLSVGMSNTIMEYFGGTGGTPSPNSFMGQAAASSRVNHTMLATINGAAGGQDAMTWDSSTDANYDRVRDQVLAPQGFSEAQVQAVWLKEADASPTVSLPGTAADAYNLERYLGNIVRACKVRYPNLKIVFLSSRIYAGYGTTALNPEPYAYESGFSVKWLIEGQIRQMTTGQVDPVAGDLNYNSGAAPLLAWGPYLWADGLNPRSDGLTWARTDLGSDGTHPSAAGVQKVGRMLLDFMLASPLSQPWFVAHVRGDVNGDGSVDVVDLLILADSWGTSAGDTRFVPAADVSGDGSVDVSDLLILGEYWPGQGVGP